MSAISRIRICTGLAAALALGALACGDTAETPAAPKPAAKPAAPDPPAPPAAPDAPAAPKSPAADEPAAAAISAADGDVEAGRSQYQVFCASCHGPTGDGDGPVAQAMEPKPARHSDGSYMNPLSDDYLFQVIKFGGASVGKSQMMAPLGGSLSDEQIVDVIAFIRSLADPPYQP